MQVPPHSTAEADALEEAQFRARMNRVSKGASLSGRRRETDEDENGSRFRLGWFGWLLIDALVVAGTILVVLTWPPLDTCRTQGKTVGFLAGDSVEKCVSRGIGERLTSADQNLKMILRGSGH
ncbi:hypothetical protein ACFQE0_06270 [Methylobacterium komagatae]|uniref:Uncharacterized protein n=1 Tax=Methylobacterium komagatae TaxID=374425 RepID=A0ABW2BGQ3_9HYPH